MRRGIAVRGVQNGRQPILESVREQPIGLIDNEEPQVSEREAVLRGSGLRGARRRRR